MEESFALLLSLGLVASGPSLVALLAALPERFGLHVGVLFCPRVPASPSVLWHSIHLYIVTAAPLRARRIPSTKAACILLLPE